MNISSTDIPQASGAPIPVTFVLAWPLIGMSLVHELRHKIGRQEYCFSLRCHEPEMQAVNFSMTRRSFSQFALARQLKTYLKKIQHKTFCHSERSRFI